MTGIATHYHNDTQDTAHKIYIDKIYTKYIFTGIETHYHNDTQDPRHKTGLHWADGRNDDDDYHGHWTVLIYLCAFGEIAKNLIDSLNTHPCNDITNCDNLAHFVFYWCLVQHLLNVDFPLTGSGDISGHSD